MYKYVLAFSLFAFLFSQNNIKQYFKLLDNIIFIHDTVQLDQPLTGGYQSLFVQVLDWDSNNKYELFVLNSGYKITNVYEQENICSLEFRKKKINFLGLNLIRWFQFVDFDSDGDWDVLTLDPEFDILGVQINNGDNTFPIYGAFQRIKNTDGDFIIPETGNLPVLYDIDRDSKLDLFITTQGAGHIEYFQNVGRDTILFELKTRQYSNVQVVAAGKNQLGKKHGKSTFAFVDFDKDGDEDILWGDQFQPLFYYLENTGTWDSPNYVFTDSSFPQSTGVESNKNYNLPIITDLNNDGKQDFFMLPQTDNFDAFHFYTGKDEFGKFDQVSKNFISTIDYGLISNIDFYDFTGDGKDDLIISTYKNKENYFDLYYYEKIENAGEITFKQINFNLDLPWKNDFKFAYDFQILDLNSDDVWDITFVDENGTLYRSLNEGTNNLPKFSFYFEIKNSLGNQVQYHISDIDVDGDLDLFYTNIAGEIKILSTEGALFSNQISTDSITKRISGFISFDQKKYNEFVLYNRTNQKIYELILDKFNFVSLNEIPYEIIAGLGSSPAIALNDINSDGKIDFIFGNFNGGLQIFDLNSVSQSNLDISYNLLFSSENSLSTLVNLYLNTDRVIENEPIIRDLSNETPEQMIAKTFSEINQIYRAELNLQETNEHMIEVSIIRDNDQNYLDTMRFNLLNNKNISNTLFKKYNITIYGELTGNAILSDKNYSGRFKENDEIIISTNNEKNDWGLIIESADHEFLLYDKTMNNWNKRTNRLSANKKTSFQIVKKEFKEELLSNSLEQNTPNPFNLSTQIKFTLKESSVIELQIYNSLGQRIKNIYQGSLQEGIHSYLWDGKNNQGKTVSSGIYFYVLKGQNFILSNKMILLK
jgi:flagellar hook assembly protein FlgD